MTAGSTLQPVSANTHDDLTAWRAWLVACDLSPTTVRLRCYQLARFAEHHPALRAVTVDELAGWLAGHGWDTETKRSQRSALRSFYGWAHASGRIDVDPSRLLPRIRPKDPAPRPAPAGAVAAGMLAADRRVQLMLTLAVRQGLRAGEIALVNTAEDLMPDLTGWTLVVHGKGRKERMVPLAADVVDQLRALPPGWAFPGHTPDGHLSAGHVSVLMARALPAPWTAHTLRHAFATNAWRNSRDLLSLAKVLGHARPETTRRYVAVELDDLRAVVESAA